MYLNYIDTWGVYQCFEGIDEESVDIKNRKDFFYLVPNGKVFHCVDQKQNHITLKYGNNLYQVNAELYKIVREPRYKIGQIILIANQSGKVMDIYWHYKKNEPFYYIKINGNNKTKRYLESELL